MKKKKRPLVPPPLKSLKRARQITSAFHAAEQGRSGGSGKDGGRAADRVDRSLYQAASQATTDRHRTTSRYVFSSLTRHGRRPPGGAARPALLEIGAVNTQLSACPWLAVRAIDIRPSARGIERADFFDLAPSASFDCVVCAMVLNCVPDPAARGDMLVRMRGHLKDGPPGTGEGAPGGGQSAGPGGLAIVALPRRCVEAAPAACGWDSFEAAMAAAGLSPVLERRVGPKVAFWTVGAGPRRAAAGARTVMTAGSEAGTAAAVAAGRFAVTVR